MYDVIPQIITLLFCEASFLNLIRSLRLLSTIGDTSFTSAAGLCPSIL
jgi:hypothetical protein